MYLHSKLWNLKWFVISDPCMVQARTSNNVHCKYTCWYLWQYVWDCKLFHFCVFSCLSVSGNIYSNMTLDCTWKQVHCCRVKFMAGYRGSTFINNILPQFNMWREKKIILVIAETKLFLTNYLLRNSWIRQNSLKISDLFPDSSPLHCLKTGFCFRLLYIYILPSLDPPKIHILKYSPHPYLTSFMVYSFEYRNYIYSFPYFCSFDK